MPKKLFKPGNKGRPKGAVGKITKTVKETVLSVFTDLQEDKAHNLKAFAKKYPRDFYYIASKLIPTEMVGSGVMKFVITSKKK
jgi:hypothetical protein